MKNKIERDFQRRLLIFKTGKERRILKVTAVNQLLSSIERQSAIEKLQKKPLNQSLTRLRHRCLNTFRSRGVFPKYGLSRIELKRLASECILPGFKKISW